MEYNNRSVAFVVVLLMMMVGSHVQAQLSNEHYSETCPMLFPTVRQVVQKEVAREGRIAASLLRLFFHDCFVNGCDASVLLDDNSTFVGEKTAGPNNNSLRGFEVVDRIKTEVESICPNVVSCADIIAVATRDSVVLMGGPSWSVKVGRRDSTTASFSVANSGVLPPPTSTLANLIARFEDQGLTQRDLVALSGAHTIGQAKCVNFRKRIYNASNIDHSFALSRQRNCPAETGSGDNNASFLDLSSPGRFDRGYFKQLVKHRGLLTSDQTLFDGGSTDSIVQSYRQSRDAFFRDFVRAIIKMGDISPLTGSHGEIRKNCRKPN